MPTTYGHLVVDEAQDHSAMNLRLLARRAERGSMTILGDLAQATSPVAVRSWERSIELLSEQRGDENARVVELTVGYRVRRAFSTWRTGCYPSQPRDHPTRSIRPGYRSADRVDDERPPRSERRRGGCGAAGADRAWRSSPSTPTSNSLPLRSSRLRFLMTGLEAARCRAPQRWR
ncbi:MAG: hypothetical protein R2710_15790 [Acidimicrobiales bacterium]